MKYYVKRKILRALNDGHDVSHVGMSKIPLGDMDVAVDISPIIACDSCGQEYCYEFISEVDHGCFCEKCLYPDKIYYEDKMRYQEVVAEQINLFVKEAHKTSKDCGWWDGVDINDPYVVATKLCLIHSEISEALEGHRKGLNDDKLVARPMIEVELADALLRLCDLCGAMGLDLGGAAVQKMAFNRIRSDHKKENRGKEGGKKY